MKHFKKLTAIAVVFAFAMVFSTTALAAPACPSGILQGLTDVNNTNSCASALQALTKGGKISQATADALCNTLANCNVINKSAVAASANANCATVSCASSNACGTVCKNPSACALASCAAKACTIATGSACANNSYACKTTNGTMQRILAQLFTR